MPKCPILSLPPEIRNYIHELVFASPPTADLVAARPPPKALTITCCQINVETSGMFKAAYRSFWSTTKFIIDGFEDGPLGPVDDPQSVPVIARSIDEHKKAKIYAKIQELRDEDIARVSNVFIYSSAPSRCRTLGDPTGDSWATYHPTPDHPKHRWIEMYLPYEKAALLAEARFDGVRSTSASRAYTCIVVHCWKEEDVEAARQIISRTGLSKEELMCPVRAVCDDDSQAAWSQARSYIWRA